MQLADASRRVPVPCATSAEQRPDGTVVVKRRRFGPVGRAFIRMLGGRPDVEIRLDRLGSAAWRLMDGRRNLAAIRVELEQIFPTEAQLPVRLGKFVGLLASKRMIELE